MTLEAVIFDLDDTLCRATAPVDWEAVTAHHLDASLEERRWLEGPAALRTHLAEYGVGCTEKDAVRLWEALWRVPPSAKNHHLFPDAVATVLALSARG